MSAWGVRRGNPSAIIPVTIRKTLVLIRNDTLVEKLARVVADHPQPREQTKATAGGSARPSEPAQNHLAIIPPTEVAMTDLEPIVNYSAFQTFVQEVGGDSARAIFNVFFAETSARLKVLAALSCASDRDTIETEAHTVKGASGTFGLIQVSVLAETLEHSAQTVSPAEYRELLDRLEAGIEIARAEVEDGLAMARV